MTAPMERAPTPETPPTIWLATPSTQWGAASSTTDSTIGWCDDQVEFEFGLGLLLDGLEKINRQH